MAIATGKLGAAIRGEFPILAHTTYLNSCSQGALSHRVKEAVERWLEGWDENGAEWHHWVERAEAARGAFARLLHAEAT
jgi:selenocysteine lyase/cysteine desulfurase